MSLIEVVLGGVITGGLYALIAIGFNLQYGVARILNLAYGEFLMAAAFAAFWMFTLAHVAPLLGMLAAVLAWRDPVSDEYRLALVVGLLGGFTTFSAFGFETYELLTAGRLPLAALNVAVQIVGGLAAVWLGQRLGSAWV